jgi:hypothetical protein
MRDRRLRGRTFHGVVSIGASNAESFGFRNPETTPLSIPTNPATPPLLRNSRRVRWSDSTVMGRCDGFAFSARYHSTVPRARLLQALKKLKFGGREPVHVI